MKVIQFQGNSLGGARPAEPMSLPPVTQRDLTPSPDVYLSILKRKLMKSNDITVARGYLMEINAHMKVVMICVFFIMLLMGQMLTLCVCV